MAFYAFECNKTPECPGEFTVNQSMDLEKHEANCPVCGESATRLLCIPGMQFKGSGFHCNDYPKGRS